MSAAEIRIRPIPKSPVSSYNEWDPLEEVIVGHLLGAAVPAWDVCLEATMPEGSRHLFQTQAGQSFPTEHVHAAEEELNSFVELLRRTGVIVRRPSPVDHRKPFATPNWSSPGGLYSAMPRDLLLVVGTTIIDAPMAWRSRYFELDAYRELLVDYLKRGGRWISAPRPRLSDTSYDVDYDAETPYLSQRYLTTEAEPTFDAADFIRCGRDIFVQRSHVTNELGIRWLERALNGEYSVHQIEVTDPAPMHLDASLMPLAPGKLLINPERVKTVPRLFSSWEVRAAPCPALPAEHTLYMSTAWVSMNVLMLDSNRVVVEAGEHPLREMLCDWGFTVIPVEFKNVMRFGGSFHCVTADVRRAGELQSYFR